MIKIMLRTFEFLAAMYNKETIGRKAKRNSDELKPTYSHLHILVTYKSLSEIKKKKKTL